MDNVICAIVLDLLSALINERYCAENVILATFNTLKLKKGKTCPERTLKSKWSVHRDVSLWASPLRIWARGP